MYKERYDTEIERYRDTERYRDRQIDLDILVLN